MTLDSTTTIGDFLAAAAAKQPTPGGGGASALVGALAAAMGEMVLNYSVGKADLQPHRPRLDAALHAMTNARHLLVGLMIEDQSAYAALAAAKKLPTDSPERAATLDAAGLAGIRVPQAMGAAAVAILDWCDRVADIANVRLLSDLAVCADLAMAVVRCSGHNVRVNLPELKSHDDRKAAERGMQATHEHGLTLVKRVLPRVWQRIEGST